MEKQKFIKDNKEETRDKNGRGIIRWKWEREMGMGWEIMAMRAMV
jgi:hypothetical protein